MRYELEGVGELSVQDLFCAARDSGKNCCQDWCESLARHVTNPSSTFCPPCYWLHSQLLNLFHRSSLGGEREIEE